MGHKLAHFYGTGAGTESLTATGASALVVQLPEAPKMVVGVVRLGTVTGTTPTLNIFLQDAIPVAAGVANAVQVDWAALTQLTASNQQAWVRASVAGNGEEMHGASDAALTAGQIRNGGAGTLWTCKHTITGTNPVFAVEFSVLFSW